MKHLFWVIALSCAGACASSNSGEEIDAGGSSGSCQTTADCEDDGLYCNGGVVCREGDCLPTDAPECGDGINCTVDSCSEAQLGCVNVPNDDLCDEGLACLDGEGCGVPPACEFTNDCNDDAFTCNGVPECIDGACLSTELDCVDSDVCTEDSCVEGTGCVNDPYDFMADVNHCTAACIPCPLPTQAQVHVDRECDTGVCGFVCQTGFWDVNNNMADGCEVGCPTDPTTTVDVPDDAFLDQNCDGIDGTVANGIFVAEDGSNANPGTMMFPVKTITNGLAKAVAGGKAFLYISAGNYPETVSIDASNDGIGLHGGYLRASDWARDGTRGVVTGPRTGALRLSNVGAVTVVEYLQFVGATATVASTSSHGVVVSGCTEFRPRHITATAGNGAAGLQGGSAGVTGDDGGDGTVGASGYEDDGAIYCDGSGSNPPADNAAGGDSCIGATVSTIGGVGHRGCKTNSSSGCAGAAGAPGNPNPPGTQSDGGSGVNASPGNPGYDGANGGNGTDNAGGAGGTISGSEWVPSSGSAGGRGVDGTGGGGGAGGGSDHSTGTCNDWGGTGGGGGGGGCGGTGGAGGSGGGASIAILLINSTVTALDVDVVTGNGGTGGAGRNGGGGGPGGDGAAGGNGFDESRGGGQGGNGGNGGRGGHGSGGAGGWTIGVYRANSSWSDGGTTNPTLGNIGLGGASSGSPGSPGTSDDVY